MPAGRSQQAGPTGMGAPSGTLAGYEFVHEIGRGSTGVVYLCRELASGREVAVKRLLAARADEIAPRRMRREQRLLRRLRHPGIVSVHDLIEADGELLLVLEHVPGTTLRALMDAGPLAAPEALEALRQLADALDHAHKRGVVHRDLTPANVLITADGHCKLADFGIAKLIDATRRGSLGSFRTRTGAILGTALYISPEAASGVLRLDARADIYGLGVLAYELLLGRPPFPFAGDPLTTIEAHISQPPPSPSTISPGFPADVEAVLLRALQKQPRRRQHSVQTFWEQLNRAAAAAWPGWQAQADLAVAGRTWHARPDPGAAYARSDHATLPATQMQRISGPVFRPRRPRRWSTLLVGAAAGLIAAAILTALSHVGL